MVRSGTHGGSAGSEQRTGSRDEAAAWDVQTEVWGRGVV